MLPSVASPWVGRLEIASPMGMVPGASISTVACSTSRIFSAHSAASRSAGVASAIAARCEGPPGAAESRGSQASLDALGARATSRSTRGV